jgi:hypothetical protein
MARGAHHVYYLAIELYFVKWHRSGLMRPEEAAFPGYPWRGFDVENNSPTSDLNISKQNRRVLRQPLLFTGDKVLFRKLLGNHHIGWHVIQAGCCVFHPSVRLIQEWY